MNRHVKLLFVSIFFLSFAFAKESGAALTNDTNEAVNKPTRLTTFKIVDEAEMPVCELSAQWVEENKDNLPQSYNEFLITPAEYRRAIFSALTPETKSEIWVEHLKSFFQNNNKLSQEQASLVTIPSPKLIFG